MDELKVVYPSDEIFHSNKKKVTTDTCYSVEECENITLSERLSEGR